MDKLKKFFGKDKDRDGGANSQQQSPDRKGDSGSGEKVYRREPRIWAVPPGTQAVLQSGRVKHNMKIVIRGAPGTGKTCLLMRLAGSPVPREYTPSTEIKATTAVFCCRPGYGIEPPPQQSMISDGPADDAPIGLEAYKGGTEVVRIDVMDVVDPCLDAPLRGSSTGVENKKGRRSSPEQSPEMALPPEALAAMDVYSNCDGVIFMVDPRRKETWDYVTRMAPAVPKTTAVIVCLNFFDAVGRDPSLQQVQERDVAALCTSMHRTSTPILSAASDGALSASSSWFVASTLSGLGMNAVYTSLNVPLAMQRARQLESEIKRLFRGVESVQAELLQLRAQTHFAAKEFRNHQSNIQASPARPPPAAHHAQQPVSPSPTREYTAVVTPQSANRPPAGVANLMAKQTTTPAKHNLDDVGKIDDSFFGEDSEEEPPSPDSSDGEVHNNSMRKRRTPNNSSGLLHHQQQQSPQQRTPVVPPPQLERPAAKGNASPPSSRSSSGSSRSSREGEAAPAVAPAKPPVKEAAQPKAAPVVPQAAPPPPPPAPEVPAVPSGLVQRADVDDAALRLAGPDMGGGIGGGFFDDAEEEEEEAPEEAAAAQEEPEPEEDEAPAPPTPPQQPVLAAPPPAAAPVVEMSLVERLALEMQRTLEDAGQMGEPEAFPPKEKKSKKDREATRGDKKEKRDKKDKRPKGDGGADSDGGSKHRKEPREKKEKKSKKAVADEP